MIVKFKIVKAKRGQMKTQIFYLVVTQGLSLLNRKGPLNLYKKKISKAPLKKNK